MIFPWLEQTGLRSEAAVGTTSCRDQHPSQRQCAICDIAGAEASTGPDLALSHKSARNGLRGLPDLFGRLAELEALLV